jgi:hypothetical protein
MYPDLAGSLASGALERLPGGISDMEA